MSTISEKLELLKSTKENIKQAIIQQGVSVSDTDPFALYADKIRSIEGGGGCDEPYPFQPNADMLMLKELFTTYNNPDYPTVSYTSRLCFAVYDDYDSEIIKPSWQSAGIETSDGSYYEYSTTKSVVHIWNVENDIQSLVYPEKKIRWYIMYMKTTAVNLININLSNTAFYCFIDNFFISADMLGYMSNLEYFDTMGENTKLSYYDNLMSNFYEGLPKLKSVPVVTINSTAKSKTFNYMFRYNTNLINVPDNVFAEMTTNNMAYMFDNSGIKQTQNIVTNSTTLGSFAGMYRDCFRLEKSDNLNLQYGNNIDYYFQRCYILNYVNNLSIPNVTTANNLCEDCWKLNSISFNGSNKITSMAYGFRRCYNLREIIGLDADLITNFTSAFDNCYSLIRLNMTNIQANLDLSDCIAFNREGILEILNNLKTVSTAKSITLERNVFALLSEEDKAIATNKNWRIIT